MITVSRIYEFIIVTFTSFLISACSTLPETPSTLQYRGNPAAAPSIDALILWHNDGRGELWRVRGNGSGKEFSILVQEPFQLEEHWIAAGIAGNRLLIQNYRNGSTAICKFNYYLKFSQLQDCNLLSYWAQPPSGYTATSLALSRPHAHDCMNSEAEYVVLFDSGANTNLMPQISHIEPDGGALYSDWWKPGSMKNTVLRAKSLIYSHPGDYKILFVNSEDNSAQIWRIHIRSGSAIEAAPPSEAITIPPSQGNSYRVLSVFYDNIPGENQYWERLAINGDPGNVLILPLSPWADYNSNPPIYRTAPSRLGLARGLSHPDTTLSVDGYFDLRPSCGSFFEQTQIDPVVSEEQRAKWEKLIDLLEQNIKYTGPTLD